MKTQMKIYALALILMIPVFLFARLPHRRAEASIEIINHSQHPLRIELDGRLLPACDYRGYSRQYLSAGRHRLLVLEIPRRPHQRPRILYDRIIRVQRGSEWTVKIDRRGRVRVRKNQANYCQSCQIPYSGSHRCETEDHPSYHEYGHYGSYENHAFPMPPQRFLSLRAALLRSSFESSRQSIFRAGLQEQYLSTAQLRELLACFDFESTRLEMARYAYPHLSDPENVALVFDAFEFESSIRSFERFLAQL